MSNIELINKLKSDLDNLANDNFAASENAIDWKLIKEILCGVSSVLQMICSAIPDSQNQA